MAAGVDEDGPWAAGDMRREGCDRGDWDQPRGIVSASARPYATRAINSISTGMPPGSTVVPIALRA